MLNRLELTDGDLMAATLDFQRGLNVVSGPEDRGKTYAFQCLDFLFGAKKRPKRDVPESAGYTAAWLYFTLDDDRRGAVKRLLDSPRFYASPYFDADSEIPAEEEWRKISISHAAKSENISSMWLAIFGVEATKLRSSAKGDVVSLTVRHVVHMALVDEGRMNRDDSPLLGDKGFSDTAYHDAFAVQVDARANPPVARVEQDKAQLDDSKRALLSGLLEQIEESLGESDALNPAGDAFERFTAEIEAHRTTIAQLSSGLNVVFARREQLQRRLTEARSAAIARSELRSRLRLLSSYYATDLRRLEAIAETTHYLNQLDNVPCPTCERDWESADSAQTVDLNSITQACSREAEKIRSLSRDLDHELVIVGGEVANAEQVAEDAASTLASLNADYRELESNLSRADGAISLVLRDAPNAANRMALMHQRDWLREQIGPEVSAVVTQEDVPETQIGEQPVKDLCKIIEQLLVSWGWHYTPGDLVVDFDWDAFDLRVGGRLRESFGKAVRGLIVSALSLAILEYCVKKSLPHPGFVVLDSPLTAHGGQDSAGNTDKISLEVQNAFFEEIAERFKDQQVIVIDNKVPPDSLAEKIKHIRFGSEARDRYGFFPSSASA
ncbi:MAG: hypothetical protein NTY19_25715 [Planctomycetota bacterium]|nr:hypothetical protein [Planctomycetota bacterium]